MRLLKDVKIGKLVQNISENAFTNQSNLETVSLNSSYIIKNSNLKNVFGNQVKYYIIEDDVNSSIGQKAFYECTNLESLIIGKNVPGISEQALRGCTSLSSIEIPKNIKNIESFALGDCGSDSKPLNIIFESENPINLVDSNNNIIYAFGKINSDDNLPIKIFVPINFEQIYADKDIGWKYYSQFINNLSINIFYYNNGETIKTYDTIINNVDDKSNLSKVQIGNKVTNINKSAFSDCNSLTSVIWNAKNCNDSGQFGSQVKTFVFGSEVENIPAQCCDNMFNLTSIEIPNSVALIGSRAFANCSSLTSIEIPNSVANIGDLAFANCSSLTSIEIPNSVTSIGQSTFNGCRNLASITIPNSVTSVGGSAFKGCTSLKSATIPNSVTYIGWDAFNGCNSLTSVIINSNAIVGKDYSSSSTIGSIFGSQVTEYIIGDKVKSIGSNAFRNCSGLTSVTIPNSVTSIGTWAFMYCSGLTSVTIGNSVESIGVSAFEGCSSLTSVTIPNSVTSIGNYAFSGCTGLTSPVYNAHVFAYMPTSYSGAYTIPDGIESIAVGAFSGCTGLTSVTIPNSVTSIGRSAFYNCSCLESITCSRIEPPSIQSNTFFGVSVSIPVYVPTIESVKKYQSANYWSEFINIQVKPAQ